MHTISRTAIALFRTANDAASSDTERANASTKLLAYCNKHSVTLADIVAAVDADTAKPSVTRKPRTAKPADKPAGDNYNDADAVKRAHASSTSQPKPERASKPAADKPAKPANEAKAAAYAEREALVGDLRKLVAATYDGASLAVRGNPKRIAASAYASLLAAPKHRTTLDRVSVRDESALMLILTRGTKAGAFDPVELNLDSGIFSRLASIGFVAADGDRYALTKPALAHARSVAKRAA